MTTFTPPKSILLEHAPVVRVKALPSICLEYARILWGMAGQEQWYRDLAMGELRQHVAMCMRCLRRLRDMHDLDQAGPEAPELDAEAIAHA